MIGIKKGILTLKRTTITLEAGYCFAWGSFSDLLSFLPFLHPKERAFFHALKYERRKTSYLLGRIAAKNAVSVLSGANDLSAIFIDSGVFHFPVVRHEGKENIQVSISHTGFMGVALAFPESHPMGIDLETIKPNQLEAIGSQLTDGEKRIITQANIQKEIGFTALWTVKEALSKIFRTGLTLNFKVLEVKKMTFSEPKIDSLFLHSGQYKAQTFCGEELICTIVLPKKTEADLDPFWSALGYGGAQVTYNRT